MFGRILIEKVKEVTMNKIWKMHYIFMLDRDVQIKFLLFSKLLGNL